MSDKKLPPEFEHTDQKNTDQQPGQRALTRRDFVKIAGAVAGAASVGSGLSDALAAAAPKPKMDKPTIICAPGATQASINVQVCGGAGTGAPAGFTLQWETAEAYAKGPDQIAGTGDDNTFTGTQCSGSFSGNANGSRYNLSAGECVTVNLGDLLFDEGASTSCPNPLVCGTTYAIRAFAHASNTLQRSDFTATLFCSTLPCDEGDSGGCTFTQGYWKTHNPIVCATDPSSPLCLLWPASSLQLGNNSYDVTQLLSILNTPAQGNGLLNLAHQLIAAKLNIAAGADPAAAATAIADADTLIGNLVIPPVNGSSDSLAPSATSALTTILTNYNEGATGPGHCAEDA
jgi:hypothetical protein